MFISPESHRERPLRIASLPSLPLERGGELRDLRLAYHLDGILSPARDNVVLVLHALTGSADAAGDWWRGLIGPGAALDTRTHAVLAPNLPGSCYGSSGPEGTGDAFPRITTRDMAHAVAALLDQLGIGRVALVTGGSLGGMVALEFVATFPWRSAAATVFAAPAAQPAVAIGWSHVQREALRAGGREGLALARQVAMLSYRTAEGLGERFGRREASAGTFGVQSWLTAHGAKLEARFSPASYRLLLDAMDVHDVARGRSEAGAAAAAGTAGTAGALLRASRARLTGVGIPGDLFCPDEDVRAWTRAAGAAYRAIHSPHGHDAFLIETEQVAAILRESLGAPLAESRSLHLAESHAS